MSDAMQQVFDGTEAIQDALHAQEGCERALRLLIAPMLAGHADDEQMFWALIDSMAHYRCAARDQAARVCRVSYG